MFPKTGQYSQSTMLWQYRSVNLLQGLKSLSMVILDLWRAKSGLLIWQTWVMQYEKWRYLKDLDTFWTVCVIHRSRLLLTLLNSNIFEWVQPEHIQHFHIVLLQVFFFRRFPNKFEETIPKFYLCFFTESFLKAALIIQTSFVEE